MGVLGIETVANDDPAPVPRTNGFVIDEAEVIYCGLLPACQVASA